MRELLEHLIDSASRRAAYADVRHVRRRAEEVALRGRLGDGPLPTNLVMAGGRAADLDELCRPVERGIYVTRLWYANVLRPEQSLFTAVTRDGTFQLTSDGELYGRRFATGAVCPPLRAAGVRFTGSAEGVAG